MIQTLADAARYLLTSGETKADQYALSAFYGVLLIIGVGSLPLAYWPLEYTLYRALRWTVWGGTLGVAVGVLVRERRELFDAAAEDTS